MKKEQRKAFEKEIISSIEQILTKHDTKAAEKIRKHIKEAGKTVMRKFVKAVKHPEKPAKVKTAGVKKAAAATLSIPAKKIKPVKTVKTSKKVSK